MEKDLGNYRKSYEKGALLLQQVPEDPMALFKNWFIEVDTYFDIEETNAMTLSTLGLDEFPKSRVVLLKKYNTDGFVFYTNYNSEKGKAITANPKVSLSFFWPAAERQILIKGKAEKIAEHLSDVYFKSRPHGSQLGALVSNQSTVVKDRAELESKLEILEKVYQGKTIARPKHWGGFIVTPVEVEFWQGRPNRLHDRIRYTLQDDFNWKVERLAP